MHKKVWFAALVCALIAGFAYLPALRAEFAADDRFIQAAHMPLLKSPGDAFKPPREMGDWNDLYYRPAVLLTYMLDERLTNAFAGSPEVTGMKREDPRRATVPHFFTWFFHLLATASAVFFAGSVFGGQKDGYAGVWAAGLVFALHPVHNETVSAITGRSDSLVALFLTLAIYFALKFRDRGDWASLAVSVLTFFVALLCKEVALTGILLLPLCLWLVEGEGGSTAAPAPKAREAKPDRTGRHLWWLSTALFAGAEVVYFALRFWAGAGSGPSSHYTFGQSAVRLLKASAFFVHEILIPWPVNPFIMDLPGPVETLVFLAAALLLVMAAVYAFTRGVKLYVLCLVWFAATAVPSMAGVLKPISQTVVVERYLYVPSIAFALAVGGLVVSLSAGRARTLGYAALGALLLAYGATAWWSTGIWKSDLTLLTKLTSQPDTAMHPMPWVNLGLIYSENGNDAEAERHFRRVVSPSMPQVPKYLAVAYNGLGNIRMNRAGAALRERRFQEAANFYGEAESYFFNAEAMSSSDWLYTLNLGKARMQRAAAQKLSTGVPDTALLLSASGDIERAGRLSPGNPEVQMALRTVRDYLSGR